MASLGQVSNAKWTSQVEDRESSTNRYMLGASREMEAALATRAQLAAKLVTPTVDESRDIGPTRHSGLPDLIGQAQLPLSFGLADTTSHTRLHVASTLPDATTIPRDST